jgi:drug/metabolite transporter (DMT)-like permease
MHPNWFLISLISPILLSIVNHADKYLLSKHFKGRGIGSIFLFSSVFSVIVLPVIVLVGHVHIFNISLLNAASLFFVGMLNAIAFYLYLKALNTEETSVVIPLLQMIPIFGYFLSIPILGEVLTTQQLLASMLVIFGIIILSIDFDIDNNISIKKKILLLVMASSFFFSLHDVLFKYFAINDSHFLVSTFWQYLGLTTIGLIVFIFNPIYRKQFLDVFRQKSYRVLSINFGSEVLYILGNLTNNFATLLAPVALVLVVSSYQPLFVFIIGTFLTLVIPSISVEKISFKHLAQKVISIIIIIIGSYFLYSSSIF